MNKINHSKSILQFAIIIMIAFLASCAPEPTEEVVADYTGTWTCSETTSNPAGSSTFST